MTKERCSRIVVGTVIEIPIEEHSLLPLSKMFYQVYRNAALNNKEICY